MADSNWGPIALVERWFSQDTIECLADAARGLLSERAPVRSPICDCILLGQAFDMFDQAA